MPTESLAEGGTPFADHSAAVRPHHSREPRAHALSQTQRHERALVLLRLLLQRPSGTIEPEPSPFAPLGYECPVLVTEGGSEIRPELGALEELAGMKLLDRTLVDRVNTCPDCGRCQLNFQERCPVCSTLDLRCEPLVHHFACAHSGPQSDFERGLDLECPKCRETLHQLGRDFDRPSDVLRCVSGGHLFDEPVLQGLCLHCSIAFPADDLVQVPVHAYRVTPLAARAVELGRLTGLDVAEILFDASLRLESREFLDLQVKREILRMRRYGGCFALGVLAFRAGGRPFRLFREWPAEDLRSLVGILNDRLRELDCVARLDDSRLAVFLLAAQEDGAETALARVGAGLEEYLFKTSHGQELEPVWLRRSFAGMQVELEEVRRFLAGDDAPPD